MNYRAITGFVLALNCASVVALPNLSFEDDPIGSPPAEWQVTAADAVLVVGTETASEFPIYGELNVTVAPNRGQQMVRLGTPKLKNESQNRGANTIAQTFEADNDTLDVALRVFSVEHRGDDFVRVDVHDATGQSLSTAIVSNGEGGAFVIDVPRGTDPSCTSLPCQLNLDVGNRQDRLASGWQRLRISNLPTDNQLLTLSIELVAGENEAHASWLYVDGLNAVPVAQLDFNPGNLPDTIAQESDVLVFDCLGSSDADGDALTCSWTASGPGVPGTSVEGDTALFSFNNEGNATVTLTVSDGEFTDSVSRSISIEDGAPLANAIDVEVLPNGSVELLCRYLDPGALDQHTVSFDANGPIALTGHFSENEPALSSGFATAIFDASGLSPTGASPLPGSCSVADNSTGKSTVTYFAIHVLDPTTFADENALNMGSTLSAPLKQADASFLGGLTHPGSIAVYELRLPDGNVLPVGAEVNISVDVPVDFDVALLSGSTEGGISIAPWVSAPWVSAPWVSAPWVNVPFVSVPFVSVPWVSLPFVSVPWISAPWVSAPWVNLPLKTSPWISANFKFADFPLSQVGLAAPDGSQISGIDISFEDLALNNGNLTNEPVRVKALSAEFGTKRERMLVKIGPGEQGLFLAVIPQAGSFSTAPFNVQVETSVPPPQDQILVGSCTGKELVPEADTGAGPQILVENGSAKTLIITQRERMMETFGMDDVEYATWLSQLNQFFIHSDVQAKVISVPAWWYTQADLNPCVVAEQNHVATRIRDLINAERNAAPIEYVQLMGSLDIVPPYYVPDETQTGYEGLYSSDLWVKPGTPLSVAIAEGNNITDAYYVDSNPQPFRGRSLYTEDISVSRMVETPAEIAASAARFVANNGIINISSTQTTGYDFFIDGTERVNEILQSLPVPTKTLNRDTWTAAELRCQFFGQGTGCPLSELNAVNAHMTYNGGVSAAGFFTNDATEVFGSAESFEALNGVTFSIGCHSGLSVPDAWALPDNVGLPLNPARDWVQEQGAWVGSYNFAYGDSEVDDRGTEGIMPLVIANFVAGDTLGNALIKAKWQYGTGLYEFGVYDEKSMIALNLFGMPQATMGISAAAPAQASASNAVGESTSAIGTAQIHLLEQGATTDISAQLELQSNNLGSWFTLNGSAQAIVGRPLLPVIKPFEIRAVADGGTSVHGVVLRGGLYTDYIDEDPVFPVQQHDWVKTISEPNPCVETMTPTQIASATRFDTPDSILQSLIVQAGQFECTLDPIDQGTAPVTGTFRIWEDMEFELMHPNPAGSDDDFQPVVVTQQDLIGDPITGDVTVTFNTLPGSDLREIVALVYRDLDGDPSNGGPGIATAYTTGEVSNDGPHTLVLPDAYNDRLSFQYVDVSGNVLAKTLKGALLRPVEVRIVTSVFSSQGNTTLVIEVEDFASLVAPYAEIDFGDGSLPSPFVLELTNPDGSYIDGVVVDGDGNATLTVDHDYSAYTGDSVTVVTILRASGAQGQDSATLSACSDPVGDALVADGDIVSCGLSAEGNLISVDLYVDGNISNNISYRLRLAATNQQIRYSAGSVTAPNKLRASVTTLGSDGLRFTFRGNQAGWPGSGPFDFSLSTQDGVSGGPSAGTVDTTQVYSFEP